MLASNVFGKCCLDTIMKLFIVKYSLALNPIVKIAFCDLPMNCNRCQ